MSWTQITELSEQQRDNLYHLYQDEWWTQGRTRDDIEMMVDESDEIVAFCDADTGELVAFSRILTDYVYKVLIFDVIVAGNHRGKGLGTHLMDGIIDHPNLTHIDHFELYCLEEVVAFYEQWEFTNELGELRLMRREE